MPVRAPYAFVPLSDRVFFPPWADLVSHDVPFKDGWCGEIEIEIRTLTPLVVGAEREKKRDGSGEVRPYRLPDGRFAIPPSSLQGMIRNVLEIATFGRMEPLVEDRRFGIRNPNRSVREIYLDRILRTGNGSPRPVTYHVRTGWLQRDEVGEWRLTPCNFARVPFCELAGKSHIPTHPPGREVRPSSHASRAVKDAFDAAYRGGRFWAGAGTAFERSTWWTDLFGSMDVEMYVDTVPQPHTHNAHQEPVSISYRQASFGPAPRRARQRGTLVLTGKMSHGFSDGDKKQEWFFYDNPAQEIVVQRDVRRDFLAIHQPADGNEPNPNWKYWRERFEAGERIPVFWLPDPAHPTTAVQAIGTAQFVKLPHEKSTHDLLPSEHEKNAPDFATLVFGSVADKGAGLKRRATFSAAVFGENVQSAREDGPRILMGPKPSYYPCYVRQPVRDDDRLKGRAHNNRWVLEEPYATYTPVFTATAHGEARAPQLAGWKRFPAANGHAEPFIPEELADKTKLHTRLATLPAKANAIATMHFHNMRGNELGGLVWALTWGGETADDGAPLRHRLGMGKAFGLGQVDIRITRVNAIPNDQGAVRIGGAGDACASVVQEWMNAFVREMDAFIGRSEGGWRSTEQIGALLAMADPNLGDERELWYMSVDEHMDARNEGCFLPSYPRKGAAKRRRA